MNRLRYLLAALLSLAGCSTPHYVHGIPNFSVVEPGLVRGGQPTALAQWQWLHDAQGVRYDIKLNPESEGSDDLARQAGIEVIHDPITTWEQTLGEPSRAKVFAAANIIIERKSRGAVLVHCLHGQDRTGIIVGVYEVTARHRTKRQARVEMLAHGYHPLLRGLDRVWEDYVR